MKKASSYSIINYRCYRARGISIEQVYFFFLGLVIWVLFHPYTGIGHDATLYVGQAIASLGIDFSQDLFFKFGSQKSFTLFPVLHGYLIEWLGVSSGTEFLYWTGTCLWFGSFWYLLTGFKLKPAYRVLGVFILSAANYYYDNYRVVFRFSETFLTARLFSEALSLLALALFLRARLYLSLSASLFSVVVHPLIGIWALSTIFLSMLGQKTVLLLVFLFSAIVLALTVFYSYLPETLFSYSLLTRMDAIWVDPIRHDSPWLFPDGWYGEALFRFITYFFFVFWISKHANSLYRRVAMSVAYLSALAFVVFFSLGSVENPLSYLIQVQLWRVQWLLIVIVMAGWLIVVEKSSSKLIVCTLLLNFLAINWLGGLLGLLLLLVLVFIFENSGKFSKDLSIGLFSVLLLFSLFILSLQFSSGFLYSINQKFTDECTLILRIFAVLYMLFYLFDLSSRSFFKKYKLLILVPLGLIALCVSDGRSGFREEFERAIPSVNSSQNNVPINPGQTVFFIDSTDPEINLQRSWFYLRRPYFYSKKQTVGRVFQRDTSVESGIRMQLLVDKGLLSIDGGRYYVPDIAFLQPLDLKKYCFPGIDVVLTSFDAQGGVGTADLFGEEFNLYPCYEIK